MLLLPLARFLFVCVFIAMSFSCAFCAVSPKSGGDYFAWWGSQLVCYVLCTLGVWALTNLCYQLSTVVDDTL